MNATVPNWCVPSQTLSVDTPVGHSCIHEGHDEDMPACWGAHQTCDHDDLDLPAANVAQGCQHLVFLHLHPLLHLLHHLLLLLHLLHFSWVILPFLLIKTHILHLLFLHVISCRSESSNK